MGEEGRSKEMVFDEELAVAEREIDYPIVKYCIGCGKEWNLDKENCCKGFNFFNEDFNKAMKKYTEMYRSGEIVKHYDKAMKKGSLRMNKKRMIVYLLNHVDKLNIEEKMVEKILTHIK